MAERINIGSLNDALPPGPNSSSSDRLGVFGGSSYGFADGIIQEYAKTFYSNKLKPDPFTIPDNGPSELPRAIGNSYALYNFRGFYGGLHSDQTSLYRDQPNNPIMGGATAHNVSVGKLIDFFQQTYPKISYKPADFIYGKYYKKIPINHLITLRRFPMPVEDNIYSLSLRPAAEKEGDLSTEQEIDATQVAGVTAVTYLGEAAGNKLDEILNFSYGLNWKELTSEMESISSGDGGYTQQPFYSKIGGIGRAIADASKGVSPGQKFASQNLTTEDRLGTTFANFVIGPVNVINQTMIRDTGLKFSNDMKLTFEYELKSLNYVNPKIAMIDIISNMLTMSTNNAQFWGGGHRYYGSSGYVASQFGDISKLRKGDFAGYVGSVVSDVETGFRGLFGDGNGGFSLESGLDGLLKAGKTFLGNILGEFLGGQIGGPTGTQATKALISGEATGNWHVTVGNPLNPIVTMGNMICDNSIMTLGSGLGYDDFPMEVKFELDIKHGKPRDKGDIENMFNSGRGRIYASAEEFGDTLNLRGVDIPTYGSTGAVGTNKFEPTQSAAGTGGTAASDVSVDQVNTTTTNQSSIITDNDPQYTANLVALMIDS
jgi:hypothetical protein